MRSDTKAIEPPKGARALSVGQYKLDYFVRKYDLTTIQARVILARAGSKRDKANAAAIAANSK
jgi:hypothetical protein